MLKVVSVVDKKNSAIDRMAQGMTKYMDRLDYRVIDCHPKRPSPDQLANIEKYALEADVIDAQYFKTIEMLRERYPQLKEKPTILTMHNPYSITESDWNDYQCVIANNKTIHKNLGEITQSRLEMIPNTVDTDFWTYNLSWSPNNRVMMVAARIESKKGILEVAQACKKIGAQFVLVGSISDPDYFHEIIRVGGVEFHQSIPDEKLRELYYNCSVHVCNSKNDFESGTNPIIESMLCGTPVLTRKVGHVPDMDNGENMVVRDGSKEDVDDIAKHLKEMLDDPDKLKSLRDKAWQTAKARSHERRAYLYQKLYREVMYPEESVTVITPVCGKPEITEECQKAIENQTHKNIEHIIINDGEPYNIRPTNVAYFKRIENNQDDYGLARARNKGTIEATGDIIVFCDQRMIMDKNAVAEFVKNIQPTKWLYGQKGGIKKEFVENLSCINRDDIIRAGMFNERIDMYGGQSQEVRTRFRKQGNSIEYIESAKAEPMGKSSNRNRKRAEIIKIKTRLWKMGLE